MTEILFVCTGNICRSPIAEALLADRLDRLGVPARVRSAGMLGEGVPAPLDAVLAAASLGVDTSGHYSRELAADDLATQDLILAMAREHLRHAVLLAPDVWPRTFTLKELVRRGSEMGPRAPGEELADWIARVHVGRERLGLLGSSLHDDVADPMGGPRAAYEVTAREVCSLVDDLVDLLWPGRRDERGEMR